MKLAVVETGGKQFLVKPGDKLNISKIVGDKGASVTFDKVLLRADGDNIEIGKPYVSGANVEAKVIKQDRADKVLVMKYHNKTRYRRKRGHRQHFTQVEIVTV
jgi:large subunit ribosomal protein L21